MVVLADAGVELMTVATVVARAAESVVVKV
jgi:hypothetical protein